MYAKFSNGAVAVAPQTLTLTFSNPTDAQYRYAGYKPVIEAEQPSFDPNTQRVNASYTETETEILQSWTVEDIPQDEIIGGVIGDPEGTSADRFLLALNAALANGAADLVEQFRDFVGDVKNTYTPDGAVEYAPGITLSPNAYYMHDGIRYVFVAVQARTATEWATDSVDMEQF